MKLSKNFSLREMTRTSHRRYLEENHLRAATDPIILSRLVATCSILAQPIRDHFEAPLAAHSGFRYGALNKAIGGSKSSQHMKGEAIDFHVVGHDLRDVFEWIWQESGLWFGQLILEGNRAGQPSWIHMSLPNPWRPRARCGQVKVMDAGKWTTLDTVAPPRGWA